MQGSRDRRTDPRLWMSVDELKAEMCAEVQGKCIAIVDEEARRFMRAICGVLGFGPLHLIFKPNSEFKSNNANQIFKFK